MQGLMFKVARRLASESSFTFSELNIFNSQILRSDLSRFRVVEVLNARLKDDVLVICEASGWIVPVYQTSGGVGFNDGDIFSTDYMNHGSHNYAWTHDQFGDAGWCYENRAVYVEREDRYITEGLRAESYCRCPECSELYDSEDGYYLEENDTQYCSEECADEYATREFGTRAGRIHSYNTRVDDVLGFRPVRGVRYFGIELEQEFPDHNPASVTGDAMELADGLSDIAIWKSDGSLSNGAELVTLPLTLKRWQGYNPVQALCRSEDWRSIARSHNTRTCGLHVHVSRETIPEPVIAKIVYLMNEPCMADIIERIARRPASHSYTVASKKRWHSDMNHADSERYSPSEGLYVRVPEWKRARDSREISKRQYTQGGRYTPVNLTGNTIEFRIFRGTLKWETIQASIEFCEAVISFCTLNGASRMNDTAFVAWLECNATRKVYPGLRPYLESRGVLQARPARAVA